MEKKENKADFFNLFLNEITIFIAIRYRYRPGRNENPTPVSVTVLSSVFHFTIFLLSYFRKQNFCFLCCLLIVDFDVLIC